jgi:hypothetical protein
LSLLLYCVAPANTGAAADGQGVLEVRVKDHREAIGDFSKLTLTFDKIAISPKPGLKFWRVEWKDLAPTTDTVDLTQYIGDKSARVFRGGINPGSFDAIHLRLKGIDGTLKKNQRNVSIKNMIKPIKLRFEVQPKNETLIVLDLVLLDMSDHPPRAYELDLRGYGLYTNGKLVDKIPPGA